MHKNIVKAIEKAIKTSPYYPKLISYEIESKKTSGFWKMTIVCHESGLMAHIHHLAMNVGYLHGEMLGVNKERGYLYLS